jgi:ribosomal protein S2
MGKAKDRRNKTSYPLLVDRVEAKVCEGVSKVKVSKAMSGYRYSAGRGKELFYDVQRVAKALGRALQVIGGRSAKKAQVLVVCGTTVTNTVWSGALPSSGLNLARTKWRGGLLTNFGSFLEYTPRFVETSWNEERKETQYLIAGKARRRYELHYSGMKTMTERGQRPDLLVFLDAATSRDGIKEGYELNIPMIGFANQETSSAIVGMLTYVVPGNTSAVEAQVLYKNRVEAAYASGREGGKTRGRNA